MNSKTAKALRRLINAQNYGADYETIREKNNVAKRLYLEMTAKQRGQLKQEIKNA